MVSIISHASATTYAANDALALVMHGLYIAKVYTADIPNVLWTSVRSFLCSFSTTKS